MNSAKNGTPGATATHCGIFFFVNAAVFLNQQHQLGPGCGAGIGTMRPATNRRSGSRDSRIGSLQHVCDVFAEIMGKDAAPSPEIQ